MSQQELLTELNDWADGGGPACNEGAEIADLMRAAAAEIQRQRDVIAFLRGHIQQNAGGGGQSFAYVWQSVWEEFERRLNG
jgi:hypothetical protein